MNDWIGSILDPMNMDRYGLDFSCLDARCLLPDAGTWGIVAAFAAFCMFCIWDNTCPPDDLDHRSDT
jgi:hypothetical protein